MQETYKPDDSEKNSGELFLNSLRQATGPQHKKLEEHFLSKMLMSPAISMNDYAAYLVYMKGIMEKYDNEVLPFLQYIIPGSALRRKYSLIKNDIDFLQGREVRIPTVEKFNLPELTSIGFAMGVAYVIEGSTLGGRVIIKNLQSHLAVNETEGARFFAGYGQQTGPMWKQFLDALVSFALQNNSEQEIIAGAQSCFQSIYNHFDKIKILNEV